MAALLFSNNIERKQGNSEKASNFSTQDYTLSQSKPVLQETTNTYSNNIDFANFNDILKNDNNNNNMGVKERNFAGSSYNTYVNAINNNTTSHVNCADKDYDFKANCTMRSPIHDVTFTKEERQDNNLQECEEDREYREHLRLEVLTQIKNSSLQTEKKNSISELQALCTPQKTECTQLPNNFINEMGALFQKPNAMLRECHNVLLSLKKQRECEEEYCLKEEEYEEQEQEFEEEEQQQQREREQEQPHEEVEPLYKFEKGLRTKMESESPELQWKLTSPMSQNKTQNSPLLHDLSFHSDDLHHNWTHLNNTSLFETPCKDGSIDSSNTSGLHISMEEILRVCGLSESPSASAQKRPNRETNEPIDTNYINNEHEHEHGEEHELVVSTTIPVEQDILSSFKYNHCDASITRPSLEIEQSSLPWPNYAVNEQKCCGDDGINNINVNHNKDVTIQISSEETWKVCAPSQESTKTSSQTEAAYAITKEPSNYVAQTAFDLYYCNNNVNSGNFMEGKYTSLCNANENAYQVNGKERRELVTQKDDNTNAQIANIVNKNNIAYKTNYKTYTTINENVTSLENVNDSINMSGKLIKEEIKHASSSNKRYGVNDAYCFNVDEEKKEQRWQHEEEQEQEEKKEEEEEECEERVRVCQSAHSQRRGHYMHNTKPAAGSLIAVGGRRVPVNKLYLLKSTEDGSVCDGPSARPQPISRLRTITKTMPTNQITKNVMYSEPTACSISATNKVNTITVINNEKCKEVQTLPPPPPFPLPPRLCETVGLCGFTHTSTSCNVPSNTLESFSSSYTSECHSQNVEEVNNYILPNYSLAQNNENERLFHREYFQNEPNVLKYEQQRHEESRIGKLHEQTHHIVNNITPAAKKYEDNTRNTFRYKSNRPASANNNNNNNSRSNVATIHCNNKSGSENANSYSRGASSSSSSSSSSLPPPLLLNSHSESELPSYSLTLQERPTHTGRHMEYTLVKTAESKAEQITQPSARPQPQRTLWRNIQIGNIVKSKNNNNNNSDNVNKVTKIVYNHVNPINKAYSEVIVATLQFSKGVIMHFIYNNISDNDKCMTEQEKLSKHHLLISSDNGAILPTTSIGSSLLEEEVCMIGKSYLAHVYPHRSVCEGVAYEDVGVCVDYKNVYMWSNDSSENSHIDNLCFTDASRNVTCAVDGYIVRRVDMVNNVIDATQHHCILQRQSVAFEECERELQLLERPVQLEALRFTFDTKLC